MSFKNEMKLISFKTKEYWGQRQLREKQGILLTLLTLGIFLFYQLFWNPLCDANLNLRKTIISSEKNLLVMRLLDQEIAKTTRGTQNDVIKTPIKMLGFLQKQIALEKLSQSLSLLKQVNNDSIQMQFQKINFDQFIHLLSGVLKQQALELSQFSVLADGEPGLVSAELIFKMA